MELHSRLVIAPVRAIAGDPQVAGRHALHRSVFVEQHLGGRESRENLDSKLFGLPGQPARQIAEAQRVGALVPHEGRHEECGEAQLALLRQHPVMVLGHRYVERAPPLASSRGSARSAPSDRPRRPTGCARRPRCLSPICRPKRRGPALRGSCFRRMAADRPASPRRRSPRHSPWIRVRSSFPSSRRWGALPATALLFLDRAVNAGGLLEPWVGSTTA